MPKLKLFFAACFLLPLLSSCGESGLSGGGLRGIRPKYRDGKFRRALP